MTVVIFGAGKNVGGVGSGRVRCRRGNRARGAAMFRERSR